MHVGEGSDRLAVPKHAARDDGRGDGGLSWSSKQTNAHACHARSRQIQSPVLIDVGQFVEEPQGSLVRLFASLIRLELLNGCNRRLRHSTNSARREVTLRTPQINRHLSVIVRRVLVGQHKLPRKVVKTRTKVVQAVSHQYRKTGGRLFLDPEVKGAASCVVIADKLEKVAVKVTTGLIGERA